MYQINAQTDDRRDRPPTRQLQPHLTSLIITRDGLQMRLEEAVNHVVPSAGTVDRRVSQPATQVSISNNTNAATVNHRQSFCWFSSSVFRSRRFCSICLASSTSRRFSGTPSFSSSSIGNG